jgi:hypothetical protein
MIFSFWEKVFQNEFCNLERVDVNGKLSDALSES